MWAEKFKWDHVASDINSPYSRNIIFTKSFRDQGKKFNIGGLILGTVARKNDIDYIGDLNEWTKSNKLFQEHIKKDMYFVKKLIDETEREGQKFNEWSKKEIYEKNLTKFSSKELMNLYREFQTRQKYMYVMGTTLPLIDFQNFSFIETNMNNFLKEKAPEKLSRYYKLFTAPPNNSFSLDQEIALLKLLDKYYSKEFATTLKDKDLKVVQELYPNFIEELKIHAENYGWIYYVYAGPAFGLKEFFGFAKDYMEKNIVPKDKLQSLTNSKEQVKEEKEKALKELVPDEFNEMILRLAGKIVWAKPRRKDHQSMSYFHAEKLQREIAKRLYLTLDQIRSAPLELLDKAFETDEPNVEIMNSIYDFHVTLPTEDGDATVIYGQEARDFVEKHVPKKEEVDIGDISEIKGMSAHPGKVKGIVKIINKSEEMEKMNSGDILVSGGTSPNIVPAMKKAAAIVTDEGGLTCHAAIVSRELQIPCIVGTKFITRAVKDGYLVEVDADNGLITIISKI